MVGCALMVSVPVSLVMIVTFSWPRATNMPQIGVRYLDIKQSVCIHPQGVAGTMAKIIYTHTDEAPLLATYSFLPIVEAYAAEAGGEVETRHISVAARTLAQSGLAADALAALGARASTPEANIRKLPNVSASTPKLKAAIAELQSQGHNIPDYPENA